MYPTDRKYTKEHEWVLVESDRSTVGITQFAQEQLGDIVYVELPEPGNSYSRGDVLGTIESVKAVSEIFAPISGEVLEVNDSLDEAPETVNRDPHGAGWYCRMSLGAPEETSEMLDAGGYAELVESQG